MYNQPMYYNPGMQNTQQRLQMMGAMMNPMKFMMNQFGSNPLFKQAQNMSQGKSPEQIKQTCMNICKQRGIDFDQAWNQFQSQFPMG